MVEQAEDVRPIRALADWRVIAVLCLASVLLSMIVTDRARVPTEPVTVGQIAPHTVKAPFAFAWQDEAAWQAQRDAAAHAALPVFELDEDVFSSARERVSSAFAAGRETLGGEADAAADAGRRAEALSRFLDAGAFSVSAADLSALSAAGFPQEAEARLLAQLTEVFDHYLLVASRDEIPADGAITIVSSKSGDVWPTPSENMRIETLSEARDQLALSGISGRSTAWNSEITMIARSMIRVNLTPNPAKSAAAVEDAIASVSPTVNNVERGEIVFREGDRLTERDVAVYKALQHSKTGHSAFLERLASALLWLTLMMAVTGAGLTLGLGQDEESPLRALTASAAITVFFAFLSRVTLVLAPTISDVLGHDAQPRYIWYAAPVAAAIMLTRLVMGTPRAVWVLVTSVVATAIVMRGDAFVSVYFLVVGVVALSSITRVRDRVDVLRTGLVVGGVGALFVVFGHFVELYSSVGELSRTVTIRPLWSMVFAVIGGLLSGALALAFSPALERVGFVTDHRLLELANLNHPIMKQLMIRAPGTYHHSVVVGTLAEAACEAIGANGTQAKICAYFHDIGKTLEPQYFVENQRGGVNRHMDLDPVASAEHIIAHVVEGARMAREARLPKPIIDNILMHHGTGILQYFYAKAQKLADDPERVSEAAFRYPGPKPDNREAGVIMIADKVEAATRTIKHPDEHNIRAMIQKIIASVLDDHQFENCPLTFQEIHVVQETCVNVLVGIYHQRIEYPQTAALSEAVPGTPLKGPHTITMDLDPGPAAAFRASAQEREQQDTDEITDYESIHNLPHGRA